MKYANLLKEAVVLTYPWS